MEILILSIYGLSLLLIFLFSMGQIHLAIKYRKPEPLVDQEPTEWPQVTIQLPIYNEKYVIKRLIESVCEMDYPADKLEVQVLDDSTDETADFARQLVDQNRKAGIDINIVTRGSRTGFKAGALENGLSQAKGEYLAIFDSDFLPNPDFLKKTIPAFSDRKVGLVQTRWGHVNKEYSWLTKLQAFGLDAHFTIEQGGRSASGSPINFNGTAGVWRKACILDSGGWSADTLTEDLDLSYRAQLKGWNFKYLEGVEAPAELPVIMPAVKSQQFRWNKGGAETAKKHLVAVFKSNYSFKSKVHAFLHLMNSSVFVFLLVAALLSVPVVFNKAQGGTGDWVYNLGMVFFIGFLGIGFFYWKSVKSLIPINKAKYFLSRFPMFLIMVMGLSLHNAIAVIEGWLGIKTSFIRTPKFDITMPSEHWKTNKYISYKVGWIAPLEGLLSLYFLAGIIMGIQFREFGMIIFHAMLFLGFGSVFVMSMMPLKYAAAKG